MSIDRNSSLVCSTEVLTRQLLQGSIWSWSGPSVTDRPLMIPKPRPCSCGEEYAGHSRE